MRSSKGGSSIPGEDGFPNIIGGSDKGRAVALLLGYFKRIHRDLLSVGIGDSENDFSMLRVTRRGFLVKRPDGSYASDEFDHAGDRGPKGWNRVVSRLVREEDEKTPEGDVFL